MEAADPTVVTFPVGPLGCNCSILGDPDRRSALIVDPGDDAEEIVRRVRAAGLEVEAIVHTHAHIDHINGTAGVQAATGAPVALHEADRFLYDAAEMQGGFLSGLGVPFRVCPPPEVDRWLLDGDVLGRGRNEMEVVHTPGHTPGSLCFFHGGPRPVLFSGDTLFAAGVGRTDLWGGDAAALAESIRERIFRLPEHTLVIPGHGPTTTVGKERRGNPFVRP